MQITRIGIRRGRVNAVFFDGELPDGCEAGEDGALLLDRNICDRTGLKAGDLLTEEEVLGLYESSQCERARSRAMWLLDSRDYTRKGMYDKLRRLYGDKAADFAAGYCEDIGLIDDERFALRNAELMAERGISDRDAVRRLIAKGICRETAQSAVERAESDPAEQLNELIQKKYAARLMTGDRKETERVIAALMRRGFEYGDIRDAVSEFTDTVNGIYED